MSDQPQILTARELMADPLFAGIPPKFLLWQEGLVVRRRVRAGEVLCRRGEPGNIAFLIKRGKLEVVFRPENGKGEPKRVVREPEHLILGEMACLSGRPRTADVVALEDSEVWEVRRNVLDRIMRSPAQRDVFEAIYRVRSLEVVLRNSELFQGLPPEEYAGCVEFLRKRFAFVRVNPGQIIFRQGVSADALYLVRLGHVRVEIERRGHETTVLFKGPGTVLGEIGLLALSPKDVPRGADAVDAALGAALAQATGPQDVSDALPPGQRTATCSALDHLEVARVSRDDFLEMVRRFPAVRRRLVNLSMARLGSSSVAAAPASAPARPLNATPPPPTGGQERAKRLVVRDYVEQGLYQGLSLLVLDLDRCTRCDECVNACADQHGTVSHGVRFTRLKREGLRFGNFLVTTSCRSCKDAYCMIGCPVDSIHRGRHLQIVIEDHCIGCGLCATNCPYGNIWMVPDERRTIAAEDPDRPGEVQQVARIKAATCDLCDADGKRDKPEPMCVYACPHDAAHRMTGDELLREVTGRLAPQA